MRKWPTDRLAWKPLRPAAQTVPCAHEEIVAALADYSPFYHSAVMVRRNCVIAVGGYRAAYRQAEDYDLWLRSSRTTRMANLPDSLIRYRIHGAQASNRHVAAQARQAAIAWLAHCRRSAGHPDPTDGPGPLPDDEELDAVFGPGSRAWVRRRVFREISDLPDVVDGDAWPVALNYADDSAARRRMWRIGLPYLRKRRALTGLRVAAGLLGLGAVSAREKV